MVLCPFIFVYTSSDSPQLKPQPAEVASIHWVSLRALLSSSLRTYENVDVSDRFTRQGGPLLCMACRFTIGWMQFPAIRLVPTESVYSSSVPGFIPEEKTKAWWWPWNDSSSTPDRPLLLWGITLGVLGDFLDRLPPYTAIKLWKYPTFTPPDLRLIVTLLTYPLRKRNMLQLQAGIRGNQTAIDSQTAALPVTTARMTTGEAGVSGIINNNMDDDATKLDWRSSEGGTTFHAVGILLMGYYARLRLAVAVFLVWRAVTGGVVAFFAWKLLLHWRRPVNILRNRA